MARTKAQLWQAMAALCTEFAQAEGGAQAATGGGGGEVAPADDRECESEHGDPSVNKDPSQRDWDGPSMVGKRYSECPSDYLIALARFKEWSAGNNDTKAAAGNEKAGKYASYDRKDAARARGWARRNAGKDMSAKADGDPMPEIPFGEEPPIDDDLGF